MSADIIPISSGDEFDFIEDTHTYLEGAARRLSVTQSLSQARLIDYRGVPWEILEAARQRGTNVHECSEVLDRYGELDPSWVPTEQLGYIDAWKRFTRESKAYWRRIEERRIATCGGVRYGMTFDREGFIRTSPVLVDLKTTATISPVVGLQLALYEVGIVGRESLGHYRRLAVQLKATGMYRVHEFSDPADLDIARAVLQLTHDIGDAVLHNRAIDTWCDNHGLKRAA